MDQVHLTACARLVQQFAEKRLDAPSPRRDRAGCECSRDEVSNAVVPVGRQKKQGVALHLDEGTSCWPDLEGGGAALVAADARVSERRADFCVARDDPGRGPRDALGAPDGSDRAETVEVGIEGATPLRVENDREQLVRVVDRRGDRRVTGRVVVHPFSLQGPVQISFGTLKKFW